MKILLLGIITYTLLLLFDWIWFRFSGSFFKSEIKDLIRMNADGSWDVWYTPAALVYLLMTIAIVCLAVYFAPSTAAACVYGAIFGCVAYGIYDLTNLATLDGWTVKFAVVDILWGTILCGATAGIVRYIAYWII